jgi:hypothetical protein
MEKGPKMEYEGSVTVHYRNKETGEIYSGNEIPDDSPCAICEKKFSEHTVEMHKACARKQRELLFGTHE